jgi:uncharacterized membrane protein YjjP (DUF1212 family)
VSAVPKDTATDSDTDRDQLILGAVATLHHNGAETARTVDRAAQLGHALGTSTTVTLGWSSSVIALDTPGRPTLLRFTGPPLSVAMNRVRAVDEVIDGLTDGSVSHAQAHAAFQRAAHLPASNIYLFAGACAVAASGLAIIFGVRHPLSLILIAIAAAAGGILRRFIGRLGGNNFAQVGAAALLAGLAGVLSVSIHLSTDLRLAAVCPCMVLAPGPHLLNGSLDVADNRLPLGIARLGFAVTTLLAIGTGLLIGLKLGHVDLSPDPTGRTIPLWLDVVTAGVVAICYGIFYSAPLRILYWPFIVGMIVHGLRWIALDDWHAPAAVGAGLACLVAATVILPVSHRFEVPFAVVGFASVVSLLPSVVVFRMLSGLVELQSAKGNRANELLLAITNDATVAFTTIFLMALGFVIPMAVYTLMRRPKLDSP